MKKILAIIMTAACMLCLVGCDKMSNSKVEGTNLFSKDDQKEISDCLKGYCDAMENSDFLGMDKVSSPENEVLSGMHGEGIESSFENHEVNEIMANRKDMYFRFNLGLCYYSSELYDQCLYSDYKNVLDQENLNELFDYYNNAKLTVNLNVKQVLHKGDKDKIKYLNGLMEEEISMDDFFAQRVGIEADDYYFAMVENKWSLDNVLYGFDEKIMEKQYQAYTELHYSEASKEELFDRYKTTNEECKVFAIYKVDGTWYVAAYPYIHFSSNDLMIFE